MALGETPRRTGGHHQKDSTQMPKLEIEPRSLLAVARASPPHATLPPLPRGCWRALLPPPCLAWLPPLPPPPLLPPQRSRWTPGAMSARGRPWVLCPTLALDSVVSVLSVPVATHTRTRANRRVGASRESPWRRGVCGLSERAYSKKVSMLRCASFRRNSEAWGGGTTQTSGKASASGTTNNRPSSVAPYWDAWPTPLVLTRPLMMLQCFYNKSCVCTQLPILPRVLGRG